MAKLITDATLQRVQELLRRPPARAGGAGRRPIAVPPVVKCGTLIGSSPRPNYHGTLQWLPDLGGPVDPDGITADSVILADLNGGPLTPGNYYSAVPGGWLSTGVPVYWATVPGGSSPASAAADIISLNSIATNDTYVDPGLTPLTLPSAGDYWISGRVEFYSRITSLGGALGAYTAAVIYDATAAAQVYGSVVYGPNLAVANQFFYGSGYVRTKYTASGANVLKWYGLRAGISGTPTWSASAFGYIAGPGGNAFLMYEKIG